MILGAIADDVTGATDLASLINRAGRAALLSFGLPRKPLPPADALIVATKSRMAPVEEAKATALKIARYLTGAGADQIYFKYCSTFDSTEQGNIGPVTEALLAELGADIALACPSYPAYARTVFQGHLFVGTQLLAESSMRHHPLTPMTDSNLVRFLGQQCQGQVGLVPLQTVEDGEDAVRTTVTQRKEKGDRILIADAVLDRHVATLAATATGMRLVTGGAALGGALAARQPSRLAGVSTTIPPRSGATALLSGSCSAATMAQVRNAMDVIPSRPLDPIRLTSDRASEVSSLLDWAADQARRGDFLIYSTADSERVKDVQATLGVDQAGRLVENAFGEIAARLAKAGLRRFVVAGGETSGAVIRSLGIQTLSFGEELAPGVPWTYSIDPEGYTFALKSGNFGSPDFFRRAVA